MGGNDTFWGGAGDDTFNVTGTGAVVVDADTGSDTLSFSRGTLTESVTVSAVSDGGGNQSLEFNLADGTTVSGVEWLSSLTTGSGNDRVAITTTNKFSSGWYAGDGNDTAVVDCSGLTIAVATSSGVLGYFGMDSQFNSSVSNYDYIVDLWNIKNLEFRAGPELTISSALAATTCWPATAAMTR